MMNYDWFSLFSTQQNQAIEKIIRSEEEIENEKNKENKKHKEEKVNEERIKLLSSNPHLSYYSLVVRNKTSADNFRSTWQNKNLKIDLSGHINERGLNNFLKKDFLYPSINISLLPQYSFLIQFTFTLEKPYISRDEQDFYIIDNPIRKDKVLGLPYVAPSSWKGSLRSALWQIDYKAEDDDIRRIFGNERETEKHERLRAGRLHLFPTFFTMKGLEIINPHDRKRRVGTVPILMESVPANTLGLFTLLYVPFDLIGDEEKEIKKQVSRDILLIAKGLKAMFLTYGFGAKTSSGYGIAKSELTNGKLILKAKGVEASKKEVIKIQEPEESFKKYLNDDGSVKEEFKDGGEGGLLSNKQYNEKREQLGGGSLSEFKKFRHWYVIYGESWQKHIMAEHALESLWPVWEFESFDKLLETAEEIEKVLKSEEVSQ
jgi:CRISPR-associated protein Cmr2